MARDAAGYLPLSDYAALGDGRGVALSGADGGIDWWCVPNMDSPPLFDRLLVGHDVLENGAQGGHFTITPRGTFSATRRYRPDSNVLETRFRTDDGVAVLIESLNSSTAGRLPWAELARRIQVLDGQMSFDVVLQLGHRSGKRSPYMAKRGPYETFHVGSVLGLFLHGEQLQIDHRGDDRVEARLVLTRGQTEVIAIVAGANEPLVVPPLSDIDARIDLSDQEWRDWCALIAPDLPDRDPRNVLTDTWRVVPDDRLVTFEPGA